MTGFVSTGMDRSGEGARIARSGLRTRIAWFAVVAQSILFFGHWLLYETWTFFWGITNPHAIRALATTLATLSISFVLATFLAFRSSSFAARLLYRIAATWLGFLNFLFWAAWLCWFVYLGERLLGFHPNRSVIATALFGLAVGIGLYGVVNAAWIRVTRITVRLPNLPQSWHGRMAAMISDTHLGHVHGCGFLRRIVRMLRRFEPDVVFITGDLYDGTRVDRNAMLRPWKDLAPPLGSYFVTGNHEEFSDPTKYIEAIGLAGVHVVNNEKVEVDGLQVVGIFDRDLAHLEPILGSAGLDRNRPVILLAHRPPHGCDALAIAEKAGICLQLSGHTHLGQVPPFTWIVRQIFRKHAYGLNRFGELTLYTTSGAGTWGPPLRVGSRPEIVLIRFEPSDRGAFRSQGEGN